MRRDRPHAYIPTRQEHRQRRRRQDHAPLEAAARGDLTVHDDVHAEREQARYEHEREGTQCFARPGEGMLVGLLLVRTLDLTAQLPQDQHDPQH